ncbi:hypothetical protein CDAR_289661 [Caerostris darwini]|uniref:Uncharacterized protein n=1 Tax=Caerostris darwini TaxID=1538125 RepID=A0AAV4WWN9_9ARAC|nr:hypothetical protein CDAR_289661 [Caerostris darwini]
MFSPHLVSLSISQVLISLGRNWLGCYQTHHTGPVVRFSQWSSSYSYIYSKHNSHRIAANKFKAFPKQNIVHKVLGHKFYESTEIVTYSCRMRPDCLQNEGRRHEEFKREPPHVLFIGLLRTMADESKWLLPRELRKGHVRTFFNAPRVFSFY